MGDSEGQVFSTLWYRLPSMTCVDVGHFGVGKVATTPPKCCGQKGQVFKGKVSFLHPKAMGPDIKEDLQVAFRDQYQGHLGKPHRRFGGLQRLGNARRRSGTRPARKRRSVAPLWPIFFGSAQRVHVLLQKDRIASHDFSSILNIHFFGGQ